MNKIILAGRLTRPAELKVGNSGSEYCKFTVAVDRRGKDQNDKKTDFFDCTAFGKTGAFVEKYFAKGDGINVIGRMESDKYTDKDGKNRTTWGVTVEEVYFPLGKGKSDRTETTPSEPSNADLPWE